MDKPGPVLDVKAHFNRDIEILPGSGENIQELHISNDLAKICRSQHLSEITEDSEKLEE